jgi:hypothetical protein
MPAIVCASSEPMRRFSSSGDENAFELVEKVAEKPAELAQEAAEGRSNKTPAIAITGVTLFFGVLVGVIVTIALLLYLFV